MKRLILKKMRFYFIWNGNFEIPNVLFFRVVPTFVIILFITVAVRKWIETITPILIIFTNRHKLLVVRMRG